MASEKSELNFSVLQIWKAFLVVVFKVYFLQYNIYKVYSFLRVIKSKIGNVGVKQKGDNGIY